MQLKVYIFIFLLGRMHGFGFTSHCSVQYREKVYFNKPTYKYFNFYVFKAHDLGLIEYKYIFVKHLLYLCSFISNLIYNYLSSLWAPRVASLLYGAVQLMLNLFQVF